MKNEAKGIQHGFRKERKIVEEIKKKGQCLSSSSNSRIRDLFRSGSSTLDPDNRLLLPACDPVSISDVEAPGDWEGNRGPVVTLPPGVSGLPPPKSPVVGAIVMGDGPEETGEPAPIDIRL